MRTCLWPTPFISTASIGISTTPQNSSKLHCSKADGMLYIFTATKLYIIYPGNTIRHTVCWTAICYITCLLGARPAGGGAEQAAFIRSENIWNIEIWVRGGGGMTEEEGGREGGKEGGREGGKWRERDSV